MLEDSAMKHELNMGEIDIQRKLSYSAALPLTKLGEKVQVCVWHGNVVLDLEVSVDICPNATHDR
jgi:hypothetical protein